MGTRSIGWLVVMWAALATGRAEAHAYIETFIGWSKDHAFYAITQAGTDERDLPVLCAGQPGQTPSTWPKNLPPPDADDERGCNDPYAVADALGEQDTQLLRTKMSAFVVPAVAADKGPHGETVAVHAVGDGQVVEVAIARGKKVIGRGFITLKYKGYAVPDVATAYWRDDGLVAAVDVGYGAVANPGPGYGPPTFVVVIPLDGSAANAARPKTAREQSYALNLEGMKLLKATKLDDAQKQFVAATDADNTWSIPYYNLASVASLRKDSTTAISAIDRVIDLAGSDPEAKKALDQARTDHDLDFIASQSPYIANRLGRPRTKGDDWCIAAEERARREQRVSFTQLARDVGPVVDAAASGQLPGDKASELSCRIGDTSQLAIAVFVALSVKGKPDRVARIAWQVSSDGTFDAQATVDGKTVRLHDVEIVGKLSHTIANR